MDAEAPGATNVSLISQNADMEGTVLQYTTDDGLHTILYRSADVAGNQEQTEILTVGIDTLGPACSAPRQSAVDTGK